MLHIVWPKNFLSLTILEKAYNRSAGQKALLETTLKRVREIVKRYAGSEYDVVDISMHTYARHVHDAPFEFAIVVSILRSLSYLITNKI